MLRSLVGGRRLTLTEGKRDGGGELFELYKSMSTIGWRFGQPLSEMILAARAALP